MARVDFAWSNPGVDLLPDASEQVRRSNTTRKPLVLNARSRTLRDLAVSGASLAVGMQYKLRVSCVPGDSNSQRSQKRGTATPLRRAASAAYSDGSEAASAVACWLADGTHV